MQRSALLHSWNDFSAIEGAVDSPSNSHEALYTSRSSQIGQVRAAKASHYIIEEPGRSGQACEGSRPWSDAGR